MTREPPDGWVRPWWAQRQLDPGSAAYQPTHSEVEYWSEDSRVRDCVLANTLGRSWTTIGLPETLDRAAVDPRGLVAWARWSLDWWVRASEEWVFPSRAATVRQRLVDDMPVVETILRVGGGDVVHRVSAARGAAVRTDNAARHVKKRQSKRRQPLRRFMRNAEPQAKRQVARHNATRRLHITGLLPFSKWRSAKRNAAQQAAAERAIDQQEADKPSRVNTSDAAANAVPEVFVVEIVNRTPAPVAVALAARPCNLGAFEHANSEHWEWSTSWGINEISVNGPVLTLDDGLHPALGRATVIFDRVPGDIVVGSHGTDSAALLAASNDATSTRDSAERPAATTSAATGPVATGPIAAGPDGAGPVATESAETERAASVQVGSHVPDALGDTASVAATRSARSGQVSATVACPERLANAAVVFPLVSGATLRAAVVGRGQAFKWDDAGSPELGAAVLDAVPSLDRVASGWRKRVEAGCRLELPPGRLATAALSARAAQLLSTAPFDDGPGVVGPMLASALDTDCNLAGDDLVQLFALVESGLSEQVRDLLLRQAQAQDISGMTTAMGTSVTGTSLVLAEHLLSLHPDPAYAEALGEFVTSGARWLLTRHAPQQEEPWTIREGLRASYRLLLRLGAERAANALQREAMSLPEALRLDVRVAPTSAVSYRDRWGRLPWEVSRDSAPRESGQKSTRQQPTSQQQASQQRASQQRASQQRASQRWAWVAHDTGLWIQAAVPWAPPLPFVTAEPALYTPVDFVEDAATSCGYDLVATALLAFAEARPAPARAFERLEALVSVATPTMNWPTFMHPELRTGTNGTGHDLVVAGMFVRTLLRLLVDAPDSGLATIAPTNPVPPALRFAAHWPAAWLGQPVEVHDLPSRIGSVSWAVRWHGERPALLWEVNPHDPDGIAPTVTAPGLDDSFTATGLRGEALLAPCSPPSSSLPSNSSPSSS